MKTFEEAWAVKEREGYCYGHDAIEQVRFGWELHEGVLNTALDDLEKELLSNRPTWPETWMAVATMISRRSYDPRLQVGAIIVSSDNTQVLSVGYNGNYKGGSHEQESSEPGKSGFIHAEVNALVKCDFNFAKQKHMYVTHSPCRGCAKLIINAEIARVIYDVPYRDTSGIDLLQSVGIEALSLQEAILMAHTR